MNINDFWAYHRAILKVASKLSIAVGSSNIGAVPTPQFDILEGWSSPFAPESSLDEMVNEWESENRERENWTQDM